MKLSGKVHEPFRKTDDSGVAQKMIVSAAELELAEAWSEGELEFRVLYYPVPNAPFPALIRRLEIVNTGSERKELELLDGLPRILPHGIDLHCVQVIPRHIEGMMHVAEVDGAAVFRLKQTAADSEKVGQIQGGNFYLPQTCRTDGFKAGLVVDPYPVFDEQCIYDFPWGFARRPLPDLLEAPQIKQNRTPCALAAAALTINPGETATLTSVVGFAPTDEKISAAIKLLSDQSWLTDKQAENQDLIDSIQARALTCGGDDRFARYCENTFLDNVVRGGMPVVFPTTRGKSSFYLYSRQNGDLERDYHYFVLEPAYYSQGTGHYRSVCQNRRCDTWFFPEVEDRNIVTFMNLVQTDGFNPLEVTRTTYVVREQDVVNRWLAGVTDASAREQFEALVAGPFSPGEVAVALEDSGMPRAEIETSIGELLRGCDESELGEIWEGFWVDHWFYNLDLIDTYLAVYPEKLEQLLLGNREYYFYDNPDVVLPRDQKYVLVDGRVYRYGAVHRDPEKERRIAARTSDPMRLRTAEGDVYYTNLLVKLLALVTNKAATFDPAGVGLEMEADKPGWNDSMNGLPGIVGSSLCEALELQRALAFLSDSLAALTAGRDREMPVYVELVRFVNELDACLDRYFDSPGPEGRFAYWDQSHTAKEAYREKTKYEVSGTEETVSLARLKQFVDKSARYAGELLAPSNRGLVFNADGVPHTYYVNRVTRYEELTDADGAPRLDGSGRPLVKPLEFVQEPLPSFLEGPAHMLKVHPELSSEVSEAVLRSGIYDHKLQMYKVCESLADAPFEIGRVKAWGAGWIENESVYTHMEYKYLLGLVISGRYREYYRDAATMLMPYLKPEAYGRNPLDNVSFIVSSAFPDETMHGQGLQPRLSGVTAEMIHIWTLLVAGKSPMFLDSEGELRFALRPVLEAAMFTSSSGSRDYWDGEGVKKTLEYPVGSFTFMLFGHTPVTYLNPMGKDTFGEGAATVSAYDISWADGSKLKVEGSSLGGDAAVGVRAGQAARILVVLK